MVNWIWFPQNWFSILNVSKPIGNQSYRPIGIFWRPNWIVYYTLHAFAVVHPIICVSIMTPVLFHIYSHCSVVWTSWPISGVKFVWYTQVNVLLRCFAKYHGPFEMKNRSDLSTKNTFRHGRNLANNIEGRGTKSTLGIRSFNVRKSQVKKQWEDWFVSFFSVFTLPK